jgi:hypothetical protein
MIPSMSSQSCMRSAKGLQNDQILSGTRHEHDSWAHVERRRSRNHPGFEWQPAQRDVNRHTVRRFHQQHTPLDRHLASLGKAADVVSQNRVDEAFLAAKTREQRENDVTRLPRVAPSLDGKAPDHTALPAPGGAERLHASPSREKRVHL